MATPFSDERKRFSDAAHIAARSLLYPNLFCVAADRLAFEEQADLTTNERWAALDGQMAIDRLVKVEVDGYRQPIAFTVQERFRTPDFARFRDMTITEWNTRTHQPSELYKLHAGLFLYGYFDAERGRFIEALVANVPALMLALTAGGVPYTHELKKNGTQTFIGIKFDDLHRARVVQYHYRSFPNKPALEWHITAPTPREAAS